MSRRNPTRIIRHRLSAFQSSRQIEGGEDSALGLAMLVFSMLLGHAVMLADELHKDTNKIKNLTPEQARKLAEEFLGTRAEFKIESGCGFGWGQVPVSNCLPLSGLMSLDAETAKTLVSYDKGPLLLDGLTTLDAETAKALAKHKGGLSLPIAVRESFFMANVTPETALRLAALWQGDLSFVTTLDTPDSVAIAQALATHKGPLKLPNLKKISSHTLTALLKKEDVEIPLIETLELIQEPDGSVTEDFVIPEDFQKGR